MSDAFTAKSSNLHGFISWDPSLQETKYGKTKTGNSLHQTKQRLTCSYNTSSHWWKVCWIYNNGNYLLDSARAKYATLQQRSQTIKPDVTNMATVVPTTANTATTTTIATLPSDFYLSSLNEKCEFHAR